MIREEKLKPLAHQIALPLRIHDSNLARPSTLSTRYPLFNCLKAHTPQPLLLSLSFKASFTVWLPSSRVLKQVTDSFIVIFVESARLSRPELRRSFARNSRTDIIRFTFEAVSPENCPKDRINLVNLTTLTFSQSFVKTLINRTSNLDIWDSKDMALFYMPHWSIVISSLVDQSCNAHGKARIEVLNRAQFSLQSTVLYCICPTVKDCCQNHSLSVQSLAL